MYIRKKNNDIEHKEAIKNNDIEHNHGLKRMNSR